MASIFKKKQFWGGLIAAAILVFLFYDLDLTRTLNVARELDLLYLIPALLSGAGIIVFKTFRWKTIVSKVRKVLFWPTLCLYATSQLIAVVLPALTGQAGRVLLFSRKGKFSKTYAFSTIFLEVVLDGAGLIILMMIASSVFVFPEDYRFISYIIGVATLFLLILFYFSLRFQKNLENFIHRRIRPRSRKVYLVIRKFIRSFNDGISVLRSTDKLFSISINTILAWACNIGAIYFLFFMFNFDLPVWAAVVVIIVNYLALMVPITPGNLGSFQLAVVASLKMFSVPKTEAVLFSVMLYLVDMIPMLVMAAFFLFKEHFSISEISEDEELIEEVEKMVVETDIEIKEEVDRK
ncbi:MAG: flippase-like domain-containing protein [candidate division Zixibacteria bacterium]|nr:flippase-like domain-containing protein [candidate division Zixibacteria bacterium]